MMKAKLTLVMVCLSIATLACGTLGNLVGGGKAPKASELWGDVPAPPDMTKADIDLPLPMRLAVQAFIKAAAQSDGDVRLDQAEAIAFNSSGKPADIGAYYSVERMASSGWTDEGQPGCNAIEGNEQGMTFCLFGKTSGDATTILIIAAVPDESAKNTQVYFLRASGAELKATAKP